MKKFALFATAILPGLVLVMGFAACKKTNGSSATLLPQADSVTATINGTSTLFSAEITVDSSSTPGTMYIVAHADSANFTPLLEITITGGGVYRTGVYMDSLTAGGSQGLLGYTGWNGATDDQFNSSSDTVTLTVVNKTTISGTFQGTCAYLPTSNDSTLTSLDTVTITNGKFSLSRVGQ